MKSSLLLFAGSPFVLVFLACQIRAQTCVDVDDDDALRQAHIDVIKRTLLFKLQLPQEPENPSVPVIIPQEVLDEYHAVTAAQELVSRERVGCTEQPIHPPQFIVLPPLEVLQRCGRHGTLGDFPLNTSNCSETQPISQLLTFDLDLTDKQIVTSAELRLWYHVLERESHKPTAEEQTISIYHVIKLQDASYYGEDPTHFTTREQISLEKDGYVSFNITSALRQWLDSRDQPKGKFLVEVYLDNLTTTDDNDRLIFKFPAVDVVYTDLEGRYSKTTQLVIRAYSNDNRARRQNSGGSIAPSAACSVGATRNCCKRNLVIDIHRDLNWTWILKPRSFSANFCSGFCPITWPTATYHTLLRLIYLSNSGNPTSSPTPCCVPDKFVPLPLLILYNQTTVKLVTIDDISIDSCICR